MATLFIYLIKVNAALILFCLGYYLVLRPLTFYTLNRVYLVGAILFSTAYPLINFSGFINRHQQIARPVQMVAVNWQAPVNTAIHTVATRPDNHNWPLIIFWAGVLFFAGRFILQIISLYRLHKRSVPMLLHRHSVRAVNKDINPFSFLKSIYVNPKNHEPGELKTILEHEQVHVNEWHTLDILAGELSLIFYWFNPGVWLMKRAIHENIEYITHRRVLQNGLDAREYQYSLLNVNFNNNNSTLINHFNASAIKKRIIMMNSEGSSPLNLTRYAFLLPVVAVLLLVLTVPKAELNKQVLNGKAIVAAAYKIMTQQPAENNAATATIVLPPTERPREVLNAVSVASLDEKTNAEQPAADKKTAESIPAIEKKTISAPLSINKILPIGNIYPDSIYVDGKYGDTRTLLSNLTKDDISNTFVDSTPVDATHQRLIRVYTNGNRDYKSILAMDEQEVKANPNTRERFYIVNGKVTHKEDLLKIPDDDILSVRFLNYYKDGRRYPIGTLWITTKGK